MSKITISLRYKCEQCGTYFNEEGGVFDETFLDHSSLFIFRYFNKETMHTCFGQVPDGRQRFYGIGTLVGWTYRKNDKVIGGGDCASK
jgi:hypothetical protein